ncbi:hypothetical protein N9L68_00190 [bacterium]|nr:hypothetical protein [bacterium]
MLGYITHEPLATGLIYLVMSAAKVACKEAEDIKAPHRRLRRLQPGLCLRFPRRRRPPVEALGRLNRRRHLELNGKSPPSSGSASTKTLPSCRPRPGVLIVPPFGALFKSRTLAGLIGRVGDVGVYRRALRLALLQDCSC